MEWIKENWIDVLAVGASVIIFAACVKTLRKKPESLDVLTRFAESAPEVIETAAEVVA